MSSSEYSNIFSDGRSDVATPTSSSATPTSRGSSASRSSNSSVQVDLVSEVRGLNAFEDLPNLLQRKLIRTLSAFPPTSLLHEATRPTRMNILRSIVHSVSIVRDTVMSYNQFETLNQQFTRRPAFRRLSLHERNDILLITLKLLFQLSPDSIIDSIRPIINNYLQRTDMTASCSRCNLFMVTDASKCHFCKQPLHAACLVNGTCLKCLNCSVCRAATSTSPSTICKRCNKIVHIICFPSCHLCSICVTRASVAGSPYCNPCRLQQRCTRCQEPVHRSGSRCLCTSLLCVTCSALQCPTCRLPPAQRQPDTSLRYLGPISTCRFCGSRLFRTSPTTFCCSQGKHLLRECDVLIPEVIADFIVANRSILISSSREINQLCSLAAVGVRSSSSVLGGIQQMFEQSFAIANGRVYHFDVFNDGSRSHPLLGNALSYLFCETTAVPFTERYPLSVVNTASQLRSILRQCNAHIHFLQGAYGVVNQDFFTALQDAEHLHVHLHGIDVASTSNSQLMLLFSTRRQHFQAPATTPTFLHDVAPFRTHFTTSEYESCTYPLLDPHGMGGWFQRFTNGSRERYTDAKGSELTLRKYMRFKLAQSRLLPLVPRLAQEWILDMVCRSEYQQQTFLESLMRKNNTVWTRRVASAQQIQRAVNPAEVGRRCDIPSSVRGSPSYRKLKVDMGMAQIYRFGPPTLFITITANPYWREIQENLLPGQQWYHDMFLVNLVFSLKLREFISDIESGKYFNNTKPVYVQYVIEFQKRGLPHAHILVRLEGVQPSTATEVDMLSTVSLPLPCASQCSRCTQCRLRDHVRSHMWHTCYPARCNPTDVKPATCKYGFPFTPQAATSVDASGTWTLKRLPTEAQIAEYNPQLTLAYNAHINVKVACGTRCVLYLRKYLSKGPDSIGALLLPEGTSYSKQFDNFYQNRCLTAAEAAWVACEFPFNYFNPTVLILQLHLPGEQPVYFDETETDEAILAKTLKQTQLEQYFARPRTEEFDFITFEEYFQKYNPKSDGSVTCRGSPIVAVVRNVDYSDSEHFALYMLLKVVAARSFDEIKQNHNTFEEAAIAAGVFSASAASVHSAALFEMNLRHVSLRQMISYMVVIAQTDSRHFEEVFFDTWDSIAEHEPQLRHPEDVLQLIVEAIERNGSSLDELIQCSDRLSQLLHRLVQPNIRRFFVYNIPNAALDPQQQLAVDTICQNRGSNYYINGCAGSGKTFTLIQLVKKLSTNRNVLTAAYTGIAASLLPNAFTTHKLFGLPLEDDNESECTTITRQSTSGKLLQSVDTLIIDEVSMLHERHLLRIDNTLQHLRDNNLPFGGVQVILGGDFNQLPPITTASPECMHTSTINASIRSTQYFARFTLISLTTAHRFNNDQWASFLLNVAHGVGSPIIDGPFGSTEVTFDVNVKPSVIQHTSLSQYALGAFPSPSALQMIAPMHATVNAFNKQQLNHYFSEQDIVELRAFYSFSPGLRLSAEDVRHTHRNNIPDDVISLAVSAPVFIMRNINISEGLANGAIATVARISFNSIDVILAESNVTHSIPRISFSIGAQAKQSIRHQFPLQLAFSATISKVQGKTSSRIIVNLVNQCFTHGQLYVALSRVRDFSQMAIVVEKFDIPIQNIVFQQLVVR